VMMMMMVVVVVVVAAIKMIMYGAEIARFI
jgi:hypothetical protein